MYNGKRTDIAARVLYIILFHRSGRGLDENLHSDSSRRTDHNSLIHTTRESSKSVSDDGGRLAGASRSVYQRKWMLPALREHIIGESSSSIHVCESMV